MGKEEFEQLLEPKQKFRCFAESMRNPYDPRFSRLVALGDLSAIFSAKVIIFFLDNTYALRQFFDLFIKGAFL